MLFSDIHEFCAAIEDRGDLQRVQVKVDSDQEIAAVVNRVCKQKGGGKALIFEQVKGYGMPVAVNLFGSFQRTAMALGVADISELEYRITRDLGYSSSKPCQWGDTLGGLLRHDSFEPAISTDPRCQEVVSDEDINLSEIPALKSWPEDGGRYLTLPQVYTRDPESGVLNCGMYRVQIHSKNMAGIHWSLYSDGARNHKKYKDKGVRTPVSIALGGDPTLIYAACAPLPEGTDETLFAGYLRRKPVLMARCLSNDLLVPEGADFVLEGYIEQGNSLNEGPFGNHTGFYDPASPAPLLHVERITRRNDPLYACTVVGPPPMEDCYMAKASERIFLPLVRRDHPEIVELYQPLEGIFHNCAFVGIRKNRPGEAKDLIRSLWSGRWYHRSKLLAVVDAGIPLDRGGEMLWNLLNKANFEDDILISGHRLGIDATTKVEGERGFVPGRRVLQPDPDIERLVDRRWKEYGF